MDIATLAATFGGVAWVILFFVIVISIIVAIHEYGHYIVGRWCGIHAETFSLGFGPVIWSRHDKRGTKWQVAALPLGGYVKFLGDANAASVGAAADVAPARNTMHGAPLWARAATIAAGPVFNFILAILVFAALLLLRGEAQDPLTIGETRPMPVEELALQSGDTLLEIGGLEVPALAEFEGYIESLPVERMLDYRVERDGQEVVVPGPYPYPPQIHSLNPRSAAYSAGLEVDDVITTVDGDPIFAFSQLQEIVSTSDGRTLALEIWRDGETFSTDLSPRVRDVPTADGGFETRYLIGITGGIFFEPATVSPGVGEALSYGADRTWGVISGSLTGLWSMVKGDISTCNLSGPISIARASGTMASQGTYSFILWIAVISTAVGLINLFPIPVLDGGHLVFHAYEAVSGRKPSDKAFERMMALGLMIILTFTAFALFNDITCR